MYVTLKAAISTHAVLQIVYRETRFYFEPYLLYRAKNDNIYLHGYKTSGEFEKTPPPHWCNLLLDDIAQVDITGDVYTQPHKGFNPRGKQFHKILHSVS